VVVSLIPIPTLPIALTFALDESTVFCTSWLNCCPGGVDPGNYNLQSCINTNITYGWEGTLPANAQVYSRGNITVDQNKAAGCISALAAFPCGTQTPAQWGAITSACELVIQGTIPSNSPGCIDSFECAPGNYCDPTVAGGTCTPLATQGQPCNTKINDPGLGLNPLADQMCSYLSSGSPPLFCDLINNGPNAATCQPLLANGATCQNATDSYYDDQACTAPGLCGDDLKCGEPTTYPYANFCQFYAMPSALTVALDEATAYCTSWLSCCPGGLDGGTYDLNGCINNSTTYGWEGTLPADPRVYSRGHITVDQNKAAGCISALKAFPCGTQTPAQWQAITSACELVIQGTIPSNSPGCIDSFECAPGNYCDPTVAGGTCTPLATQGQPCNTKINDPDLGHNPLADQMCSYLSSGSPALFCDLINNGPNAATCQPLLPNGAACQNATGSYYDDQACTAPALCGDNLQCGGTTSYPYPNFCQFYTTSGDAGGPG
jgi:hypothetical protein